MVSQSPAVIATVDADLRFGVVNPAFEAHFNIDAAEVQGVELNQFFGYDLPGLQAAIRQVLDDDEPVVNLPLLEGLVSSVSPFECDEFLGVLLVMTVASPDTSVRSAGAEVDRYRAQQEALRELAAHLSEAMTSQEVVDLSMTRAPDLVGAQGGLVVLKMADRGLRVAAQRTMPRDSGAKWRLVPEDVDFPAARAIRSGVRVSEGRDDGSRFVLDSLPLVVDEHVVGAVTFAWEGSADRDAEFVGAVTEVMGQALGRAQEHDRERSISVTLQRSMLPSTLPRLDGAEIGALYLPGSAEAAVGGDWFESILLEDGRLLLAVGDVMGKGLPAATTMSEFRHALKALSVVTSSPADILRHLAAYHATRSGDKDQLITLMLALVDVSVGQFTWTSAGHIPPVLVHGDRSPPQFLENAQGLPLGLGDDWVEHTLPLRDTDCVLVVSDGVVEDRRRSLVEGLAQLEQLLRTSVVGSAAQLCDRVVESLVGDSTRADDVTALCLRLDSSVERQGKELPADPASVSTARDYVAAELSRLGVHEEEIQQTAKLLTSELVTNAVRHSNVPITVCVDRVSSLVRVTVVDGNRSIRLEPRPIEVEAEHGRGLQLVEALATDWGVTAMAEGKQVWFDLVFTR